MKGFELRGKLGTTVGQIQPKECYGRIWPNGNFSLGYAATGIETTEREEGSHWEGHSGEWFEWSDEDRNAVESLTLSNVSYSRKPQTRRGLKGITSLGQHYLRSGCFLMEQQYGNDQLCMLTATVPRLGKEARVALARNWPKLVNRLLEMVQRRLAAAGRPLVVCGCTEIQSARLENQHEAYLHVHLVFPAYSNIAGQRWVIGADDFRSWWAGALERFSGASLPGLPRVELAIVQKSAERYLGKYLSKGSGETLEQFIHDVGEDAVPPQWWFMSSELKARVRVGMAEGRNAGSVLESVIQYAFENGDFSVFEWVRHVEIEVNDRLVTVGWCGRLHPEVRQDLLNFLDH